MKTKKLIILIYVFLIGTVAFADPPPAPAGYRWQLTALYSDEFNGNNLNLNKWRKEHPFWNGRKPAWFNPDAISVSDGYMKITNGILSEPFNGYNIYGGAVTSVNENTKFAYYECRLKASSSRMSTTFWLENRKAPLPGGCNGDTYSQELDIVETVGDATNLPIFATHQKSNTHFRWKNCSGGSNEQFFSKGTTTGPITAINSSGQEVNQQSDEGFHTYGAWWRDAKEVTFYLDDRQGETVQFRTDKTPTPFNRGMFICMVTETYDWEQRPTNASLTDPSRNTSYYDWVRVWTLVPDDGSAIAVMDVSVSPTMVSLNTNETEQLSAVILPFNATNKSVTWSSNNTSVAIVDTNGVVTAVAAGSTKIIATTNDGGFTATSNVTVNAGSIQTVTLSPIHDAYTQNGVNKNNNLVRVENTGRKRIGYLKYDLSGIYGAISSAQLKMTCNSDAGNSALAITAALGDSNNWTETNVSNANAPSSIGVLDVKQGPFNPGDTYTWDLNTNLLNGGGDVSLIITASGSADDVAFASKENSATEPQLVITYNSASTSKGFKKQQSDVSTLGNSVLKVYPNPIAGSSFMVDLSGYDSDVLISIFDIHGRLLYKKDASPQKLNLKSDIFQATGLYMLNVQSFSSDEVKTLLIAVE